MTFELVIIIVSWNNKVDVLRCLDAICVASGNFKVVVVDNASQDDTVGAIRTRYPQVTILANAENLGYTGGNNAGITYAMAHGADAVLLLNDDAVLEVGAIAQMLEVAAHHPEAGFLGPGIYALEESGRLISAGGAFTGEWRARHHRLSEEVAHHPTAAEVEFLSGCALLVRRTAVERIGLLDDRFFVYHEDADWCYRARQAGFKLLVVPQARVLHPDTLKRDADSPSVTYYMTRNHLLFLSKHHLGKRLIFATLLSNVLIAVNWTIQPKWRHKRRQRDAIIYALADFARGRYGRSERAL